MTRISRCGIVLDTCQPDTFRTGGLNPQVYEHPRTKSEDAIFQRVELLGRLRNSQMEFDASFRGDGTHRIYVPSDAAFIAALDTIIQADSDVQKVLNAGTKLDRHAVSLIKTLYS